VKGCRVRSKRQPAMKDSSCRRYSASGPNGCWTLRGSGLVTESWTWPVAPVCSLAELSSAWAPPVLWLGSIRGARHAGGGQATGADGRVAAGDGGVASPPRWIFRSVVSQFGQMFFADVRQALKEMVRVLTPRGHLAVAVWDSVENNPGYAVEVEVLDRVAGARAADAVRAPFVLGDHGGLVRLFEEAGVRSVAIATRSGTARFPSVRTMVEADLRGWLPVMGVVLDEQQIQLVLEEAESALRNYVTPEGNVEFDLSAHIVTGSK
jgi:hypothetical protein